MKIRPLACVTLVCVIWTIDYGYFKCTFILLMHNICLLPSYGHIIMLFQYLRYVPVILMTNQDLRTITKG